MLRYLTSGESHGKSLISILDGIPANIELNIDEINYELEKRQGGYGRGGRMKIEKDKINILGGVRGKITLGGPISIEIKNKDYENWIQYINPIPISTPFIACILIKCIASSPSIFLSN